MLAGALAWMPATPAAAQLAGLRVTLEQDRAAVDVGDRLTVRARVVNAGAQPTDRLVAHLNVATLDSGVYVDLEDWTASPTQELDPLPPGASISAAWEIQAVNVGSFDVYVVVLPKGDTPDALVASPPQLVRVAGRQTLSAGGALPVAVTVPLLLGLVVLGARLRLRRGR
ncbi:hypothetical protein GCM10027610_073020 [Dactylosporangium cerinum]